MLLTTSSAVLLVLAGVFCGLAAVALMRAVAAHRKGRFGSVSWFDRRQWHVVLLPALVGAGVAVLLAFAVLPPVVRLSLALLIGAGLIALGASFVLRSRIRVSTGGVSTPKQHVSWNAVDDYAETASGLVLFHRQGAHRRRLDLAVPPRHRTRVARITGACLDARFEYAARIYAGHQALEG